MNYLKKKFHEYYTSPIIDFPYRMERREFAFLFFGEGIMKRHISFKNRERLLHYLRSNIPAHVYYSSAYYHDPSADTMADKKWMGADLIFDLDADHLPKAEKYTYEENLQRVKEELFKLLSFLTDDFGFEKQDISIYFSGGRGYHCHVRNKKVMELGSQERREIVDYLTARGIDFGRIIMERKIYEEKYIRTIEINPHAPGWQGRLARGIISFLKNLMSMREEDALKLLTQFEGIGEVTAHEIYEHLDEEKMKLIESGKIDQMGAIKRLLKPLVKKLAVELHTRTDEPVTADIKRLIRLPGSLHGKTGLRVTAINIDEVEEFNPLRDAVVFGEENVKIRVVKPFKIEMMGKTFNIKKGIEKVPEYLAVFSIGRGFADSVV